jgi:chemotaxis protein methyltransferase CheR
MVKSVQQPSSLEFEFSDKEFEFIRKLVIERTGISIQPHKKTMVYGRLVKRIRTLGLKSFKEYIEFITSPSAGQEVVDFTNAITTNLTKFFREEHHFEHLKNASLPDIIKRNNIRRKLRIWSAGCSAGMEPYSIAMVLREVLKDVDYWDAKILATDIDTNMLATGTAGEYKIDERDGIPKNYQNEFVKLSDDKKKIIMSPQLKKLISFKQLNFMDKWPVKGPFDIIFCRNVVIYFDKDVQRVLFNKFADVLDKDGYLYIGHSESLNNVSDRFRLEGKTIYRKIK